MDIIDFVSAFGAEPEVAYGRQIHDSIKNHRSQLGGELFIDKLLKLIKLDGARRLYPPKSHKDLRDLFKEIVTSSRPVHDQLSLIYYFLRDVSGRSREPGQFARRMILPEQYRIFMDGLWCLDHLKFESAISHLTEPVLRPTFPEEILEALLKHAPRKLNLGLAYFHAVDPPVTSTRVLGLLVDAICLADLPEAFFVSRTFDQSRRRYAFERLVAFVHQHEPGEARASAAMELIALPFDETEEQWFEDYLLNGDGRGLVGASDTMIMRQVATGRMTKARELADNAQPHKIEGLDWNMLTRGLHS